MMTKARSSGRVPAEPGTSVVETTIQSIHQLIESQLLQVGDVLPSEADLARQFGTSRNSVREALRTLRAYGLVDPRQKVGAVLIDNRYEAVMSLFAFGRSISPVVFSDIQEFRRLIEEGICDQVLEAADVQMMSELTDLNERMQNSPDLETAAQLDYDFHRTIVAAAGNRTTIDVYQIIQPVILKLMENGKRRSDQRRDVAQEHRHLISAIADRDKAAYTYWMRLHLKSGLKFIEIDDPVSGD